MDWEAGAGGFLLGGVNQNSSNSLALQLGMNGDVDEVILAIHLRHPKPSYRFSIEQHDVVAGVGVHLGIGVQLPAKLEADEMLALSCGKGSKSKLGATDGRVQLVHEDLVLRERRANRKRGHVTYHSAGPAWDRSRI